MNAANRKQVSEILSKLEDLKSQIESLGEQLRELADNEQEKFDNLSEGLQQAEKGQAIEEAAGYLRGAADSCENGNAAEALDALGNLEL